MYNVLYSTGMLFVSNSLPDRESGEFIANLMLLHRIIPAKMMIFPRICILGTFHLAAKVMIR